MSIEHSPNITKDGLVFHYDVNNEKSFKGAPTTNHIYKYNPRIDSSYISFSASALGTWNRNHSDAITVYNDLGSNISNRTNAGVAIDWYNYYHAIWTYDNELKKPVVTMRDFDGSWKAYSFATGLGTFTSYGLTTGSKYTISWLQWTDDITKTVYAGLYSPQIGTGTNGFQDGLSNTVSPLTSFNTKARTWQRVYCTYTISANTRLDFANPNCYMYGLFGARATLKIADVQLEMLPYPTGFSRLQTRTVAQSMYDLTGNSTIDMTNATFDSTGKLYFNDDHFVRATNTQLSHRTDGLTYSCWVKHTSLDTNYSTYFENGLYTGGILLRQEGPTYMNVFCMGVHTGTLYFTVSINTWYNIVFVRRGDLLFLYVNGVSYGSIAITVDIVLNTSYLYIGRSQHAVGQGIVGYLDVAQVYTRGLSDAEIKQNFNALRGRFGV